MKNKLCYLKSPLMAIFLISVIKTVDNVSEDILENSSISLISNAERVQKTTFQVPDEKWIVTAIQNIAYYLRQYKFNEWDRRHHYNKPRRDLIGFYKTFPCPRITSFHWNVYENCDNSFYKCISYLNNVIETAPLTKNDDIITVLNKNVVPINETLKQELNKECIKKFLDSEKTGLPFDSPLEKFQWRTSASYYMCWYTMLGIPVLSMLGESCDNFAGCLDSEFGYQNNDPRSDDRLSFSCALYSFCPDLCCPKRHVTSLAECYKNEANPCYSKTSIRKCIMKRKENQSLKDIVDNKWNTSCDCENTGFMWKSRFGMCVDINECAIKNSICDINRETCLNLPGTYKCICKWGYEYKNEIRTCVKLSYVFGKL